MNLDPAIGAEIKKRRPALVVSNDVGNEHAATVTILPLTMGGADRHYPFHVSLPPGACGNREAAKIKAEQIRTIDKDRKSTRLNSSHIQKSRMPSSA